MFPNSLLFNARRRRRTVELRSAMKILSRTGKSKHALSRTALNQRRPAETGASFTPYVVHSERIVLWRARTTRGKGGIGVLNFWNSTRSRVAVRLRSDNAGSKLINAPIWNDAQKPIETVSHKCTGRFVGIMYAENERRELN